MSNVPSVTLSNGVQQPVLGLGTFQCTDQAQVDGIVFAALEAGYRLIDTATMYGNEAQLGEALRKFFATGKLQRTDVFLVTKLFFSHMTAEWAERAIRKSLNDLQADYIDLYIMHLPCGFKCDDKGDFLVENGKWVVDHTPIIEPWRVIEDFYKKGTFKAIGVSNFNEKQLAEIKPHNIQMEVQICWPNTAVVDLARSLGMSITSYGTVGGQSDTSVNPLQQPVVGELAQKYGKSGAQILLAHQIRKGHCVIPKSSRPERIRENADLFDFTLTDEDVKRLDAVTVRNKFYKVDAIAHHPEYPWPELVTS